MADKKETEYPAYIDYEGNDTTNPVEGWSNIQFEEYWRKLLAKYQRGAGHPFTMKDKGQLKRLRVEFGPDILKEMMRAWIITNELSKAVSFALFYTNRYTLFERTQPKDYEWD